MPPVSSRPTTRDQSARLAPAHPPDTGDGVLEAEREHLRLSREFLGRMRADVLSLRAMGGDPVSEQYLKADLYRRGQAPRRLPDTPPVFRPLGFPARAPGRPRSAGAA